MSDALPDDHIFADPRHLRADARLLGKMICLGVVEEERARGLIAKLYELVEAKPTVAKICRALDTLLKAAQVEQQERLSSKPTKLDVTVHDLGTGGLNKQEILQKEIERLERLKQEARDEEAG